MEITLGHTPDADDAFMFYGMLTGKVTSPHFKVNHVVEDIETLNKRALKHELDVTAVSVHACAYIPNYTILRSGGSFGKGYGPIVISKKNRTMRPFNTDAELNRFMNGRRPDEWLIYVILDNSPCPPTEPAKAQS